jgi:hypothetical protein
MAKLVGLYSEAETLQRDPAYLDALQTDIGLNHLSIAGAVRLSDDVAALNPLGSNDRDRRLLSLAARRLDGTPVLDEELGGPVVGVFPGFDEVGDDLALRQAIAHCRDRGIGVWITLTGWTTRLSMLCPTKTAVNDWYVAAFADVARRYPVDGINVTRTRYPMFGVPHGIEFCTCADCARVAADLGYDFPRIVADLRRLPESVSKLHGEAIALLASRSPGVPELASAIPGLASALAWLNLRADILTRQLGRISAGIKARVDRPITFGCDVHPPGVALIVGQRYADVPTYADWTGPILSHVETFVNRGFTRWAGLLRERLPALSESAALELIYRITGYDGLGYPGTVDALGVGQPDGEYRRVPLVSLIERDLAKARAYASRAIPSYPIVRGAVWPAETIARITAYAENVGHDGIIYQGTEAITRYAPS